MNLTVVPLCFISSERICNDTNITDDDNSNATGIISFFKYKIANQKSSALVKRA